MAATFYIDTFTDYTYTKKVETWVAIHFCEVCGDLLESYKKLPTDAAFCGAPVPSRERVVLGIDNCKK